MGYDLYLMFERVKISLLYERLCALMKPKRINIWTVIVSTGLIWNESDIYTRCGAFRSFDSEIWPIMFLQI